MAAPNAPVLSGSAGNTTVSLTWTEPNDNGSAITQYNVYKDAELWSDGITDLFYEATEQANGVEATWTVTAVNNDGESVPSNGLALTPSAGGGARAFHLFRMMQGE
jgi:hypothetical protein